MKLTELVPKSQLKSFRKFLKSLRIAAKQYSFRVNKFGQIRTRPILVKYHFAKNKYWPMCPLEAAVYYSTLEPQQASIGPVCCFKRKDVYDASIFFKLNDRVRDSIMEAADLPYDKTGYHNPNTIVAHTHKLMRRLLLKACNLKA